MDDPDTTEMLNLGLQGKKKIDVTSEEASLASLTAESTASVAEPPVSDQALEESKPEADGDKTAKQDRQVAEPSKDEPAANTSFLPEKVPKKQKRAVAEPGEEVPTFDQDDFPKKKKRRRLNMLALVDPTKRDEFEEGAQDEGLELDSSPWAGSDRDYRYEELLDRVFEIIRQKNPSVENCKTKLVMKPPLVAKAGAKKTSFANFIEICKLLHREPKHLLTFLVAELGTSGSIDGNNQLIIKGRFQQKQIETVLKRYIKEYVTCHTCHSPSTILQKDNRLFFLQCETCGSRCSVHSIKSGFQAVTGHRAQIRSKQQ